MNLPPRLLRLFSLLIGGFPALISAQNAQLTGGVLDSLTQTPMAYAYVSLYSNMDSTQAAGTLSDSTGTFTFSRLKAGNYYLEIRFLGYNTQVIAPVVLGAGEQQTVGLVRLTPTDQLMDEIEIRGRQRQNYQQVDRQVYGAAQFQQAQGGNVSDVLRNLPGVAINGQGEISLRGSTGFMVMLDGRQIQTDPVVLLSQLPANSIKNIEILTTPSAKYDPDGKAGIINITTLTGMTDGVYVQVNGLLGAPSIESYDNAEASNRFGGDITVNVKKGKWDYAASLDYRQNDLAGQRIGYVNTYLNEILTEFPSLGERSFDREQYSLRFNTRFRPDAGKELSVNFYAGDRTQYRTADILYAPQQRTWIAPEQFLGTTAYWEAYERTGQVLTEGKRVDSLTYYNENLRVREGDFLIGGIDYAWELTEGKKLQLSALYERTLLGGPTNNTSLVFPSLIDTLQYQFNTNDNPLDGVRVKVDYSQEIGTMNWESGYQFRFLNHPGDFVYLDRDLENNRWIENPVFTNRIELTRTIHSVYSQVSGQKGKLQYSAGLRLEYMDRTVSLAAPDTTYDYDIFQPFPTLALQYDLGMSWALKAAYSRRIQRTTTFKMTPFPEREHNETLEQGDAELLPEFIDVIELGLVKNWGDNSVFLMGYFRGVDNLINRVNTVFNDSILNRIYTNVGNARVWGAELGATLYPAQWWDLYLGSNVYRYQIDGTLFGDEINTAHTIYSLNVNSQFKLLPTLSLQLALNYVSEQVTAQGIDSRFYNPSLTLRKTFDQGRLAASLQWQSMDLGLLNSNEQRISTWRDNFYTTTNYVYEVDRVLLTLSYQLRSASPTVEFIESEFGEKEY